MTRRNDYTRRMIYNEKCCCDMRLLQMIIYFFNFLFYISSVAFIGLAIWTYTMKYTVIEPLLYGNRYLQSIILCFGIGLAVFVVASSGCWAISKRKRLLLLLYSILVLLTMLMELALCIMTYAYIEYLKNNLGTTLLISVIRDHSERNDISEALHHLHQQGRCCGSESFEDWRDSVWWQKANSVTKLKQRSFDLAVPDFCCRSERPNCGRRDHPSNIYYNLSYRTCHHYFCPISIKFSGIGCLDYLIKIMTEQLLIISGAAFAVAVVELFGIAFAVCLYRKWREFSEFQRVSTYSRRRDDATVVHSL